MSAMLQGSGNFTNQGFLLVIRVHEKRIGLILPKTNVAVATLILQIQHDFCGAMVSIRAMALSGNEMWSGEVVSTLPLTYAALKRKIVTYLQVRRIASAGTEVKLFEMGASVEKPPAPNKHVFKVQKSRSSDSNKVQKDALKKPWPRHRCGMQQYNVFFHKRKLLGCPWYLVDK